MCSKPFYLDCMPARFSLLLGIKLDDQQLQPLELFLVTVAIGNMRFIFNPYGFSFEKEGGNGCYGLKLVFV